MEKFYIVNWTFLKSRIEDSSNKEVESDGILLLNLGLFSSIETIVPRSNFHILYTDAVFIKT